MTDSPIIGPIEFDLPCTSCGYNLRGLTQSGRCPECGAPIDASLRGDLLRFANPGWLKTVRSGVDWMFLSVALAIVAATLPALLAWIGMFHLWFVRFLALAAAVMQFLAVWLIATPEPRTTSAERQVTWRRLVRFCAATSLLCILLPEIWVQHWPVLWGLNSRAATRVINGIAEVIVIFGYLTYAESFARRAHDIHLARSTRIVKWGLCGLRAMGMVATVALTAYVAYAIVGVAGAGPAATGTPPPLVGPPPPAAAAGTSPGLINFDALFNAVAAGSCALAIANLAFGLWALRLLYRYRKVLREALEVAEAGAGEGPGSGGPPAYGADR